jgi:hypothetical protein
MNKTNYAYTAGLIDGEGSILLVRRGSSDLKKGF